MIDALPPACRGMVKNVSGCWTSTTGTSCDEMYLRQISAIRFAVTLSHQVSNDGALMFVLVFEVSIAEGVVKCLVFVDVYALCLIVRAISM